MRIAYCIALPFFTALLPACATESPTEAVVSDRYGESSGLSLYRVWYATTLFRDPLGPGEASAPERTVPGTAMAYAVLAVGWDPSSNATPTEFVPVQSRARLAVDRGDTLRIEVSDRTFDGRCGGSRPLSQSDADFITQRIFPAEFAGVTYDAATCTARASTNDGGTLDAAPQQDAAAVTDATTP